MDSDNIRSRYSKGAGSGAEEATALGLGVPLKVLLTPS